MLMAQSHWRSLHVFITFNWFNYMENEMVRCAISFFIPSSPTCRLPPSNEYFPMPGREGNEISALPLSLFLSPSLPFRSWWFGSSNQEELFYCYHWKHFILVSEAPTVLCGRRASQNLKSFLLRCIILEDHYMIYSWGVKTFRFFPVLCFTFKQPCRAMVRCVSRHV